MPQGGETVFPVAGLSVTPRRGNAVYFEYTNSHMQVDQKSLHAGAPVTQGEKWVVTEMDAGEEIRLGLSGRSPGLPRGAHSPRRSKVSAPDPSGSIDYQPPFPNRSVITFTPLSQAWLRHGRRNPASMDFSSE